MLRRLVILAVFFAVTQAIVPASGQATNNNGGKRSTAQNNADSSQTNPANPKMIPKPPESSHQKYVGDDSHTQSTQSEVTIIQSTPNKRDALDYWALAINALLAIIAGGGVIAAWKGLPGIIKQAEAAKNAVTIAQQTLAHTQRPKVIARNFYFSKMTAIGRQRPNGIAEGSDAAGQFYIANNGGTDARIKEVLCIVHLEESDFLPGERPYEGMAGRAEDTILQPGASKSLPYLFHMSRPISSEEAKRLTMSMETLKLYVMGKIVYLDEIGISRTTHFCRAYSSVRKRFEPVDNPDYENSD